MRSRGSASPQWRRSAASRRSRTRQSESRRSRPGNVPAVNGRGRTALVTGASSGIGAATVRSLAAAGFEVVAAARRLERCEEVAREVSGRALRLDVTDPDSVAELAEALPEVSVVINNAGGALGLEP